MNWLPLGDDDYTLMTREYRYNPAKQKPVQINIGRTYDGLFVKLKPGQAIKMPGRLPEKWAFVSFVFYDRWYATIDYPRERCYPTGENLVIDADGTYTIYLLPEDPGHPNWIQMGKLYEGLYSYRYMVADSNPKPTIEIVNL